MMVINQCSSLGDAPIARSLLPAGTKGTRMKRAHCDRCRENPDRSWSITYRDDRGGLHNRSV